MIKNINDTYGDPIEFDTVEEMEQAIEACGYALPYDGLVEGRDYEEIRYCECCGENITDLTYRETRTKSGHDFCCYACFEAFFCGDIAEDDDFLSNP